MVDEEVKAAERIPAAVRQVLYGGSLTEEERLRLPEAANIQGLKDEIATLRARLDTVLREQPEDLKLALDAMNTLLRMVVADYRLSPRASKDLADSVAAVLNGFADQLVPSDR
jgi:hypothetical protein